VKTRFLKLILIAVLMTRGPGVNAQTCVDYYKKREFIKSAIAASAGVATFAIPVFGWIVGGIILHEEQGYKHENFLTAPGHRRAIVQLFEAAFIVSHPLESSRKITKRAQKIINHFYEKYIDTFEKTKLIETDIATQLDLLNKVGLDLELCQNLKRPHDVAIQFFPKGESQVDRLIKREQQKRTLAQEQALRDEEIDRIKQEQDRQEAEDAKRIREEKRQSLAGAVDPAYRIKYENHAS